MKKSISLVFLLSVGLVFLFTLTSCDPDDNHQVPDNSIKMVDGSGNSYSTVIIGRLTITTDDLHTTKYIDSTDIPLVAAGDIWSRTTSAFCYYDNDPQKGILYNYYSIESKKLIPSGWHSVTAEEWSYLDSLGRIQLNNAYAKAMCSTTGWHASVNADTPGNNPSTNNAWGLNVKPSGYRNASGMFVEIGEKTFYWGGVLTFMPSYALTYNLDYQTTTLTMNGAPKSMGASIRCVKDY